MLYSTFNVFGIFQDFIHATFSKFGLVYEVQVLGASSGTSENQPQIHGASSERSSCYAFVKFYSARAAAKAKKELTGRLFFKGQHMRVCGMQL